jgi:ABC-type cobalamin transport system permease subunit
MTRWLLLPAVLLVALASGCQREEAKDHVSVNGKIFIFNIRLARAYYALTLNRLPAMPDDGVVTVAFEDPAGGPALISTQKVFAHMNRIDLQSPDLACVIAGKPYKIHITAADAAGKTLQTIDTTLVSTLDQTVIPAHSLVVGAAYDRNPQAFGKDGKIIFRTECPTR